MFCYQINFTLWQTPSQSCLRSINRSAYRLQPYKFHLFRHRTCISPFHFRVHFYSLQLEKGLYMKQAQCETRQTQHGIVTHRHHLHKRKLCWSINSTLFKSVWYHIAVCPLGSHDRLNDWFSVHQCSMDWPCVHQAPLFKSWQHCGLCPRAGRGSCLGLARIEMWWKWGASLF